MSLLEKYQLFLFDFDGLLVDTERLHMEAYKLLCRKYGYELPWSFAEYQVIAHGSAHGLQQALSEKLGGRWEDRYVEKRTLYRQLLEKGEVTLMPGAAALLQTLAARNIKRVVVTHSPKEHLQMVRARLPILNTIPDKVIHEMQDRVPLKRLGQPEDIANVYAFLASDEAAYINGTVIEVAGGLTL